MENKTSKYFKYAIGEIFLVMIGILLALQVNNWNEQRKLKNNEQQLLIALKGELNSNLQTLKNIIKRHEISLKACEDLRSLYSKNEDSINNDEIRQLKQKMLNNATYDPNHGILNSIISSGQINNINNLELKSLIASLKDKTKDAFENTYFINELELVLFYTDHSRYFVTDPETGFRVDNKLLLKSKKFFQWITAYRIQRNAGLSEERELQDTMEYMLALIEKEITKP